MPIETFVSEPIKPVQSTLDTAAMSTGAPGLPREFIWRGETLRVTATVSAWRETGSCQFSKTERYVRKHWYEVQTENHGTAKILLRASRTRRQHQETLVAVYASGRSGWLILNYLLVILESSAGEARKRWRPGVRSG